jgi:hypothetical protein
MGGGVAGAIKRAGGAVIEQEAVGRGPRALPCRYVIHAATRSSLRVATGLTRIVLVAFNAEAAEAFSRVLEEA